MVVVMMVGCPGVVSSAAAAMDPLASGPRGVNTIEYSAGSLRLDLPGTDVAGPISIDQPLEGSITYPEGPGPWKVPLFLHGNHPTCILADGTFDTPGADSSDLQCPDVQGPGGEQIQTRIRNYAGYAYLAAVLARTGTRWWRQAPTSSMAPRPPAPTLAPRRGARSSARRST
jgi:hypothetical protein